MIGVYILLISVLGANVATANILNFDVLTSIAKSAVSNLVLDNVAIAAHLNGFIEKASWPQTLDLLIPNVAAAQQDIGKLKLHLSEYLPVLQTKNSESDLSVPQSNITQMLTAVNELDKAFTNIQNAKIGSVLAKDKSLLEVVNGKINIPVASAKQLLALLQYVNNQFNAIGQSLSALQTAGYAIYDLTNESTFPNYILAKFVTVIGSINIGLYINNLVNFLNNAISQYEALNKTYTKDGVIAIPAAKFATITDRMLDNVAGIFNEVADSLSNFRSELGSSVPL